MENNSRQILENILSEYGIENASEIIRDLTDQTQGYNPLGDRDNALIISSQDWLQKKGFDINLNNNYKQYLIFQPQYHENGSISFQIYNAAKLNNEGIRFLDKLNTFDVTKENRIVFKKDGRKAFDSQFMYQGDNFGLGFDGSKTSYTIGNLIDQQFGSEEVTRQNIFKYNNPANIEYAKNKILKENTEITKIKTFESFRQFSNINETQTMLLQNGYLSDSIMQNNSTLSFMDFLKMETKPADDFKDYFNSQVEHLANPKDELVQQAYGFYLHGKLSGQLNTQNILSTKFDSSNVKEEKFNLFTFDQKLIDKYDGLEQDITVTKDKLLEDVGLNKFIQQETMKMNLSKLDDVSKTQDYNINIKLFEFMKEQQKEKNIVGKQLNDYYQTNIFDSNKNYSVSELSNIATTSGNTKIIKDFKNQYRVEGNNVMFDFVSFKDGELYKNTLNLGISKYDFERYQNLEYRAKGGLLLDQFIKQGFDEDKIITTLKNINEDVKTVRTGNEINLSEVTKKYSHLTKEQQKEVMTIISEGNQIMANNIVNRSQNLLQGNSSNINHSIQGSLSAFNKASARPWQALESLNEVVTVFESSVTGKQKHININQMITDNKSKTKNYFAKTGELVNENLKQLSEAESQFAGGSGLKSRDTNKALFFDAYGVIEDGKIKHGQLAYNESMYVTKDFAATVLGSNNRNFDISKTELEELGVLMNGSKEDNLNELKLLTKQNKLEKKIEVLNYVGTMEKTKKLTEEEYLAYTNFLHDNNMEKKYKKLFSQDKEGNYYLNKKRFETELDNISKTRMNNFKGKVKTKDMFLINDYTYNQETGMYTINFNDVSTLTSGTKIHMNDGYKGTVSALMDSIKVGDMEIAGINSSKSFNRNFDGGSLYSTIETSLFLSNRQRGNTKAYVDSLMKMNYKGKEFDLFDVLNLDFNYNQETKSFSIFDKNSGIKNYLEDLTNADLIDNPHLRSKVKSASVVNKLKQLGITDLKQLDALVNENYEKYHKNGQKIYDEFKVTINDQVYKMAGKVNLKNLNITGANQNSPLKDALKVDMLTSRFFDSKGFSDVGGDIRNIINMKNQLMYSNFTPSLTEYSKSILKGKKVKGINSNFTIFQKDFGPKNLNANKIFSLLYEDMSYSEFLNSQLFSDSRLGTNMNRYLESISEPNKNKIRQFPLYKYEGVTDFNKTIRNSFLAGLESIEDNGTKEQIKDYFYTLKKAIINDDQKLIEKVQGNTKDLQESLAKLKKENKGNYLIDRIITDLNSTKDTNEIAKIINVIENPNTALNYNYIENGIFIDPKTNKVNMNIFKAITRNAMEINSITNYEDINQHLISELGKSGKSNLKGNVAFNKAIKQLNKDVRNYTSSDIKFFELVTQGLDNKKDKSLQEFFALVNRNTETGRFTKEEIATRADVLNQQIQGTLSRVENSNYFKIESDKVIKDFNKNIDIHKASIYSKLYASNKFVRENLSKKGTIITDALSYNVKASISEQVSEGSHVLKYISEQVKGLKAGQVLGDTQIYKDSVEFFGEQYANDIIFKGYSSNTIIDVTKLKNLGKQIEDIESMTLVNMDKLQRESSTVFDSFSKKIDNKRGFFGFLTRGPMQSSENIVPTYNIAYSKNYNYLQENSIYKQILSSGLDTGASVTILGKGTAARMKADNDGDKLYLSALDELFRETNSDEIADSKIKYNDSKIEASVYLANEVSEEVFNERISKKVGRRDKRVLKRYYEYYNQINKMRTQENIDSHFNIGHQVFTDKNLRQQYLKLGTEGNDNKKTVNFMAHKISNGKEFEKTKKELMKFIGMNEEYELTQKLKNPFDFLDNSKEYFKDTNVGKTGMVYTKANQVRNITDVMSKLKINETTLDSLALSIAGGNQAEYKLVKQNIEKYLTSTNKTIEELAEEFSGLNNNNLRTSMLTFEAIELGVISGKHGTKTIFEELQKLTENLGKNKQSSFFSQMKGLKTKGLDNDDVQQTKQLLKSIVNSLEDNSSKTKDVDSNLFNILKTSLTSKMYQMSDFVETIESGDLKAKMKAIDALSKDQVAKVNTAAGMVYSYSDNMNRIGGLHQFLTSAMEGTTRYKDDFIKYKDNALGFLTKALGIDINRTTREGKAVELEEAVEELSNNIFYSKHTSQQQALKSSDILNTHELADDIANVNSRIIDETVVPKSIEKKAIKSIRKSVKKLEKQAEQIQEKAKSKIKVGKYINRTKKATEKASQELGKKKINSKWLGLGALVFGAFLGYTTGRNNTKATTEQEESKMPLGTPESSMQQTKQNDLGYYGRGN